MRASWPAIASACCPRSRRRARTSSPSSACCSGRSAESAPGGVEGQGLARHVERDQLARAGERHVERAVAEAAVRGLAPGAHLDDVAHLSVRLEDDHHVAQAAGGVEPPGGIEAEAVGVAPRQGRPYGRRGAGLRIHDQDLLRHALRDVEAVVGPEGDAVREGRDLRDQLDAAIERRAPDAAHAEVREILPVVRVGVVEEAVGAEAEVVRPIRWRAGQTDGDVAHLARERDALDAPGDGVGRDPASLVSEREAAVVRDVERAVGAERGAVGAPAGARHASERTVVPERDALAADLGEGDAPGTEPDRPLGELEAGGEDGPLHDGVSLAGAGDVVNCLTPSFGGFVKQYQVQVDPEQLQARGVTLHQVYEALGRSNANAGGNYIEHGEEQYVVRGLGTLAGAGDIEQVVVAARGGIPIRIRDLARVTVGAFPRRGVVTRDREPEAVEGIVLMRRGENPSVVLDALHAKIEQLNHGILPPGVRVDTFYDRARLVRRTLTTVTHNLVLGALLVVLVVGVFLMSLRAALVVALVIPLSLLGSFLHLKLRGLSADRLAPRAVALASIVDGAVIMVEHVARRLA